MLLAARGRPNARIAAVQTRLHVDTVHTWRGRFAAGGPPALADCKRSGRPVSFTALQVAEVKALVCQLPAGPARRCRAGHVRSRPGRWSPSPSSGRSPVPPCGAGSNKTRSSPGSSGPGSLCATPFRPKAARVLDLYARTFDDVPLGADGYAISADEKTSIQARCRCHPTLAPEQARAMRVNHEYDRGGALAYLAAYDVHRARVFGLCEPRTDIRPFMNLVTQVMTTEPYASATRVFCVIDNGSSHQGKWTIDRLTKAFPNAVMVHTPVHASWTNRSRSSSPSSSARSSRPRTSRTSARSGTSSEHSKTATTPRHSHSGGGLPPPTRTICRPGSTDTQSIGRKIPPPASPHDQPRKDFERRPLSSWPQPVDHLCCNGPWNSPAQYLDEPRLYSVGVWTVLHDCPPISADLLAHGSGL
ncbi:helix-turn-helix domain-containing protein [Streptomyces celluloflavus]|uniref:helix-turn-helix domain-containing protein n=1 Tax=Streptomyces celluloflavus TaxID=58344 RepID=UPI0036828911